MNDPRPVRLSRDFWTYGNYRKMGKSVFLFIDLLSVADDSGRVKTTFPELSKLTLEPIPKLRRWLKRLRDFEYIAVQGRGNMIIVIHPNYFISPELRDEG